MKYFFMLAIFSSLLSACTTVTESNPARTATEELLISQAADRAAANLTLKLLKGTKIFVDASNFEGTDSKYAIAAIRESFLKQGASLVDDKKRADTIVEIRAGALSTDKSQMLVGLPQFNVPIPLTSSPLAVPQIALYGKEDQKAVAKFVITGRDAKSGQLNLTEDPQYGFAHRIKRTILIFFTWTESEALPTENEDELSRRQPM